MGNYKPKPSLKMSSRDFAFKEIKKAIVEGKLFPEQSIVEEEIAVKLKISRTPLREALLQLETEHWVVRKSNRRLKVAPISAEEVKELFNVRAKLEEIVTYEATLNASEKDIRKLSVIADKIESSYHRKNSADVLEYGAEFHNSIYELSANRTVNTILSLLNDQISRYRHLVPGQNIVDFNRRKDDHRKILEHISAKKPEKAAQAMKNHIDTSLVTAIKAIEIYEKNKETSIWQ